MLLQVFSRDGQLYAFKGLAGRLGPIGVHVALLMCLFGTGYSGFGGWKGTVMCPESGEFVVGNVLYPISRISMLPGGAKTVMQVGTRFVRLQKASSRQGSTGSWLEPGVVRHRSAVCAIRLQWADLCARQHATLAMCILTAALLAANCWLVPALQFDSRSKY
jgi:hypothetical protein